MMEVLSGSPAKTGLQGFQDNIKQIKNSASNSFTKNRKQNVYKELKTLDSLQNNWFKDGDVSKVFVDSN